LLLLGIILIIAAAIRLPGIGTDALWHDEVIPASLVFLPFEELIVSLHSGVHPPLYSVVLKLVSMTVSPEQWTEGVIRSVSLLFSLLSIWMIYGVGHKLINQNVGLISAFLLAINPMHVHYSREACSYMLLILLVTASIWVVTYFRERPSTKLAIICGVLMALLAYTHNIANLVILSMLMCFLLPRSRLRSPSHRKALVVMGLTGIVLYLPWATSFLQQTSLVLGPGISPTHAWVTPVWDSMFPLQIPISIGALSHGSPPPITNAVVFVPPEAILTAILSLVLIFLGVLTAVRWQIIGARIPMVSLLFVPLMLLFLVSWIGAPIYIPGRVDSIALPAYILLLAAGIQVLAGKKQNQPVDNSAFSLGSVFPVSHRFRPLLSVLVLTTLTLLSIIPNLSEYRDDSGNQRVAWVRQIIRLSSDNDVLIVTNRSRHTIQYYSARENRRLHLLGYPVARDDHPTWLRESDYDGVSLAGDARKVVEESAEIAAEHNSTVWVAKEFFGNLPLLLELTKHFLLADQSKARDSSFITFRLQTNALN